MKEVLPISTLPQIDFTIVSQITTIVIEWIIKSAIKRITKKIIKSAIFILGDR